jgi:RNA-directed DNA polymerase
MVRYADDLVVLCRWRPAESYMPKLRAMLARLRVTVNEDKTRIVSASAGFDFLGVHSTSNKHHAAGSSATAGPRAARCSVFGIKSEHSSGGRHASH